LQQKARRTRGGTKSITLASFPCRCRKYRRSTKSSRSAGSALLDLRLHGCVSAIDLGKFEFLLNSSACLRTLVFLVAGAMWQPAKFARLGKVSIFVRFLATEYHSPKLQRSAYFFKSRCEPHFISRNLISRIPLGLARLSKRIRKFGS